MDVEFVCNVQDTCHWIMGVIHIEANTIQITQGSILGSKDIYSYKSEISVINVPHPPSEVFRAVVSMHLVKMYTNLGQATPSSEQHVKNYAKKLMDSTFPNGFAVVKNIKIKQEPVKNIKIKQEPVENIKIKQEPVENIKIKQEPTDGVKIKQEPPSYKE